MAYCDQKNWLLRKALKKGHLDTYNSREKTLTCEAHYKNKFYIPNNYNTFHVFVVVYRLQFAYDFKSYASSIFGLFK